ncbi:hypothetical protein CANMA_005370, partial [Candida margitis]
MSNDETIDTATSEYGT